MDLIEAVSLGLSVLTVSLLLLFLIGIRAFLSRIAPLLDQFSTKEGKFELPKISIKQALGYGIFKLIESTDLSKGLSGLLGGGKK